jgi:signal transduction histidine kinase
MKINKKWRQSPIIWSNTTFNRMKCATRKYTVLYLIGYFVVINLLHLWLWNAERVTGTDHSITREFFILSFISLVLVILLFIGNIDTIQKELTSSISTLVEKVRSLSPQNPWETLEVHAISCDDELHEVVSAINLKSNQIQEYIDHLNKLIGYLWHEINTPLSVIQICVERISKTSNHNDIPLIQDEIQQIRKLTEIIGLLIWSDTAYDKKSILVHTLIQKVVLEYQTLYPWREILFDHTTSNVTILSHDWSLYTIIRNLVDNAIMHWWWKVTVLLDKKSITVKDEWAWIHNDALTEKIRLPFWKEDLARSKSWSYWLWLSLVKQLCKHLWLEISVASEPGKSTSFTLSWK